MGKKQCFEYWILSIPFFIIVILLISINITHSASAENEISSPMSIDDYHSSIINGRHVVRDSDGIWYALFHDLPQDDDVYLAISDDPIPTGYSKIILLTSREGGVLGDITGGVSTIEIDNNDNIQVAFWGNTNGSSGSPYLFFSKSHISTGCDDPEDWTQADGVTQGVEVIALGDNIHSTDPTIACHENGDISVVYSFIQFFYLRWDNSLGAWVDRETLSVESAGANGRSNRNMIHIDNEDNIHVIWVDGFDPPNQDYRFIYYRMKDHDSPFWTNSEGTGEIDVLAEGAVHIPCVSVGDDGTVWATYSMMVGPTFSVFVDSYRVGSTWDGPSMIIPDTTTAYWSSFGLTAAGDVILLYCEGITSTGPYRIQGNIWDGNQWSEAFWSEETSDIVAVYPERRGRWNSNGFVYLNNGYAHFQKVKFDGPLPPPIVTIDFPHNDSLQKDIIT